MGQQLHGREDAASLLWFAAVLLRERRVAAAFTVAGLVGSLAVAVLRTRTYTTVFSFLPQGQQQGAGGLASLAGQFGISLGNIASSTESPQLYADLLVTRDVLAPIAADSFDTGSAGQATSLSQLLGVEGKEPRAVLEETIRALRKDVISTTVAALTTGLVTVRVRTRSPRLSEEIAERLLDGLNRFNLVTRQSQARQERVFAEGRLSDARESLRSTEDSLLGFVQHNRVINTPELEFQRDRLQRSVTFQQQIVTSLAQEYEQDRIREVRDTPVITLIERPSFPVFPDPRLRLVILVLGLLAGLFAGMLGAMASHAWRQERVSGGNPGLALLVGEWRSMRHARLP